MVLPRGAVAGGAFRLVQGCLSPVAALAYPVLVICVLRAGRRSEVSVTVLASLYTRYMQHHLGTRADEPAVRILPAIPALPRTGWALLTAPTRVAHRLTGYVPRIYRYPYEGEPPLAHQSAARTTFYDEALARHLGSVDQIVVLGAGLDTRAHRLPPGTPVRCFEIDAPRTQAFKRELLAGTGLDSAEVVHVPVDFRTDNWLTKIREAGFDPDLPSFFLWESVTMYLDRKAVEDTLSAIAGTAAGSVVAFDYFSAETLASRSLFMRYARATTRFVGEPLTFGLDTTPPARQRIAEFLAPWGLVLEEHRTFGRETRRRHAPAGFATAVLRHRRAAPPGATGDR